MGEHLSGASRDVELEPIHVYLTKINMTIDITQIIQRVREPLANVPIKVPKPLN